MRSATRPLWTSFGSLNGVRAAMRTRLPASAHAPSATVAESALRSGARDDRVVCSSSSRHPARRLGCAAAHARNASHGSSPPIRGGRPTVAAAMGIPTAGSAALAVSADSILNVNRASPTTWCMTTPSATSPSSSSVRVTRHSGCRSDSAPRVRPVNRGRFAEVTERTSSLKHTCRSMSNAASGTHAGGVRPSVLRINRERLSRSDAVATSIRRRIDSRSSAPSTRRSGPPSRMTTAWVCIIANVAGSATYPSSHTRRNSADGFGLTRAIGRLREPCASTSHSGGVRAKCCGMEVPGHVPSVGSLCEIRTLNVLRACKTFGNLDHLRLPRARSARAQWR